MATDPGYAFNVVTFRDGRMTCVQRFTANEVDRAVLYMRRVEDAELRVVVSGRQDGMQVNDRQVAKLAAVCSDIVLSP